MITIQLVSTRNDQKEFVKLPFKLYKNNSFWIPPLLKEEMKIFSIETNPVLGFCDAAFWIVKNGSETVGRIAAIINHRYNEKVNEKLGRFSRFECIDDPQVASLLLNTAENWLREKGMTRVHGPLGFTNLDLQGMLVEGFDHLPSIASVYHLPYYRQMIENAGYEKENDWVEFRLKLEDHIPEKATRLVDMIKTRYKLSVVHFNHTREMLPYTRELFSLLGRAFDELPYVSSFDDASTEYYIKKYFTLLNPEFVKVLVDENKVMKGFIVGMPSLSRAMQKCNGKLYPFRFRHLIKAMKHPTEMDLVLTGIDPHLQGQGVAAVLIYELQQVLLKYKVPYVETTGIFETNHKAIQTWKNYEHIQHKRRRCFVKNL